MLIISETNLAGIECGKCFEPVSPDLAVFAKYAGYKVVILICIDCAEKLPQPGYSFIPARTYFEALLTKGRPIRLKLGGS